MTSFVIYTIVLLLLAFLLGAALGCVFRRRWLPGDTAVDEYLMADQKMTAEPARAVAPVEAAAAIKPEPAPEPPAEPAGVQPVAADKPQATASAGRQKAAAASAGAKAGSARKPAAAKTPAKPRTRTAAKTGTAAKTKTAAKPRNAAKADGPDDLKKLKGVGKKIEGQLHEAGITSFAQISKWTKKDIESFDGVLKFHGRIERDDWVSQAKLLATGKETEFSKRVKGGDVPTSASKAPGRRGGARKKT